MWKEVNLLSTNFSTKHTQSATLNILKKINERFKVKIKDSETVLRVMKFFTNIQSFKNN